MALQFLEANDNHEFIGLNGAISIIKKMKVQLIGYPLMADKEFNNVGATITWLTFGLQIKLGHVMHRVVKLDVFGKFAFKLSSCGCRHLIVRSSSTFAMVNWSTTTW